MGGFLFLGSLCKKNMVQFPSFQNNNSETSWSKLYFFRKYLRMEIVYSQLK